jgi:hypothetical protein
MFELLARLSRVQVALRVRCLRVRLEHLESLRGRVERAGMTVDRPRQAVARLRLDSIDVRSARIRYLADRLRERLDNASAAEAYRRQSLAVDANGAAGHSPRLRDRRPSDSAR